jgi:hypothetical protein
MDIQKVSAFQEDASTFMGDSGASMNLRARLRRKVMTAQTNR